MAVKVIRKFRLLFDVVWGTPNDGDVPTYDAIQNKLVMAAPSGSGDLSDAVILQPADSARNVITPTSAGDDGLTIQNGRLVVSPDQSTVGISVREQDVSQAFGDGYELLDAHGHKQLAIYTQRYPLDPTRREAVVELIAKNNADGSVTNGSFLVYGGGNMGVTSDSSVVYPIFWTDGDTGKKLFLLKKDGAVIFGGGGSAPPDSDLSNGGIALWLDATDGAPKVMFKGKDVDGTVFTWELPTGVMGLASDLASHLADTSDAHDASAISVVDSGGNFTATDVEGALAELAAGVGGGPVAADDVSIADSGGYYTGTDVEAALQEIGAGGIGGGGTPPDDVNLIIHMEVFA